MVVISVCHGYSKASDILNHKLLCAKLHFLGFDDTSCRFFFNYLTVRKQRVRLTILSSAGETVSGVPQGPNVGLHMFLIYIFYISDSVQKLYDKLMLMTPNYCTT